MRGGGGKGRHAYEEFTRLTRYVMARTAHSQTITAHHPTTVRVPHAASRGGHTGQHRAVASCSESGDTLVTSNCFKFIHLS